MCLRDVRMAHDDENEMSCCDCDGIGAAVHGGASNADDGVGGGMDDCDYVDEYTDEEEISFVDNGYGTVTHSKCCARVRMRRTHSYGSGIVSTTEQCDFICSFCLDVAVDVAQG